MLDPPDRELRLLLVDDNEGDLLLVRSMLKDMPGFACAMDWAGSLDEALATYRAVGGHDVYLLDFRLGRSTGLEVRRELVALGCQAPMLILTGHGDPHIDRQSMRAGAADYIEKRDLTPILLARSIQHALERAHLARALRESEERYRTLASSMPNSCVLLVSHTGSLLLAHGECLSWLGTDAKRGMDVRVAFPRPFADDLARQVLEALSGSPSSFETAVGDRRLLASVAVFPFELDVEQALVVVQDVTELRRAQTIAMANERMAEIGTLASGVAHEFNNLHGIISGTLSQLLRRQDLDSELRARLLLVHSTVERAAGVSDNLLSFARGSRGGFAQVSLRDVVQETLDIVRAEFDSEGIELESDLSTVPVMWLQRAAMGQVVMNLLINARHAVSDTSARRVSVRCGCQDGRASFCVSDTGCGIPAGNLGRIFDPFFSTKSALSARVDANAPSGTGLGLSLCRTIVSAHGGEIAVESQIGRGTSVSVLLPLTDVPLTVGRTPTRTAPPTKIAQARPPARRSQGQAVLVVEDEPHLRSLLQDELGDAGWRVRTAADGDEALSILASHDIDLVLVDMQIPGVRGDELVRRLRCQDRQPAIIAMSGHALDERISSLVDGTLAKPFDLDAILAQVAGALESRQRTEDRR